MTTKLVLDRRAFLGNMGLAAGGVAIGAMMPLSALQVVTFNGSAVKPTALNDDPCGDWTIDDMCGAYPPYSHPIPYGRPQHVPLTAAHYDLIDHAFLI